MSGTSDLADALQRGLLGVPLTILVIFGLWLAQGLADGRYLSGVAGLALALGAGYWIVDLFRQGLADR